ncbi:putative bifunctional diguanylate cyclase/phosphodiesterase [Kineococcus sp. G2]|uniref:putative bifunctional diguanylate cyclase/phosphodiesterase n=1 Tax=Kineococcus sp. G2 TaxID=3127484 RepID=UPI00301D01D9
MIPPTGRRGRGGTLQQRLLALVLVPVLGVALLVGGLVRDRTAQLRSVEDVVAQVRAAVALDAARVAVVQEAVPALVLRAHGSAATPQELAGLEAADVQRQLALARAGVDRALAEARGTLAAPEARRTAEALRVLRTRTADDGTAEALFSDYGALSSRLGVDVAAHVRRARAQGLDGAGTAAVGDLLRVSHATTLASAELPLLLTAALADGARADAARGRFVEVWGGYRYAAAEVVANSSPDVVTAWAAAVAGRARAVDAAAAAAATAGQVPSQERLPALLEANAQREAGLRATFDTAAALAVEAATAQSRRVRSQLRSLVALAAGLLAVSLVGTLVVRLSLTRPLDRLAAQARAVGAGELVDVEESGPEEVRTVARGLAAAVEGLRRLRDQAQAVAGGDLDSEAARRPLEGPLGEVVHASVSQLITAIQERERLRADLTHQASHDALTQLPNRARAQVLLERALRDAERGGHRTGLMFVDLDRFKHVNDSLGHAAGDELLRVVAARMGATVRAGDVVCRLGGDEFLVLVPVVAAPDAAAGLEGLREPAQRLVEAVSEPLRLRGREVRVGASVGVALSGPGTGPEQLLHDADAAAYRAKAAGRGVVEVFDERMRAELDERSATEEALRTALVRGELVLHYQPVLDLASGRTRSAEALVRWSRPGHGLVRPDAFVPVAERSDLVCDLGRWALREATAQLGRWDAEGGERTGLAVAVNVSGRHLASPRLLDDVLEALAAARLDPARLTVEITETVLVDEPLALEHLRALREAGVRVAIDDFGTGYTSIGQLSRLPVDVLKIDRSLVASIDAGHAALVRLVVSAAHSFGLGVVAEGVEEPHQLAHLVATRCDAAQGHLFGRAVPPQELATPRLPAPGAALAGAAAPPAPLAAPLSAPMPAPRG